MIMSIHLLGINNRSTNQEYIFSWWK